MPSYKFHYFNVKGRGESTRLLFAAAGVAYEDLRHGGEKWKEEIKPKMPFGQMPVLEVDNQLFAESAAINRYLARKFNMMGKTDEEAAVVDMFSDLMYDVLTKLPLFVKDEKQKAEELQKALGGKVKMVYDILEKQLDGKDYITGEMSLADIVFLYVTPNLLAMAPNALASYPKSTALYKRLTELPNISKWLAQRPQTAM
uniref:glutathione transferase n=1 Tax=Ciona intestinalis TaxID=7719 RepID=F6T5Q1_CIOIN|nr:glutathione S-transferase 1-like [Ciona intestinalis]|eukprot:XP_026695855.1 glutathione S-transferase 1-like [Ciona intestinalis]